MNDQVDKRLLKMFTITGVTLLYKTEVSLKVNDDFLLVIYIT